jgi:hypothetical protein
MLTESPLIQDLMAERGQRHILAALRPRFPVVPADIAQALHAVRDEDQIEKLIELAAACPDLDAFRAAIADVGKQR